MEGDEGFAGAGGEGQQDAPPAVGDGFEHALDGDVLIVAAGVGAALVLERDGGEAVAPGVRLGEGHGPEFVGGGEAGSFAFAARFHVDGVDALAVGGIGEADGEAAGVFLGLADALGEGDVPGFGFDDGEPAVAVFEDVIRDERFGALSAAFDAAGGDGEFAPDAAAFDDAPARRFQGGVDVLGSGFGFVHGCFSSGRVALQSG